MGLDYMIYKRNKQTGEETELAYGRKSWELVEELDMLPRDIDQYEYPLKKEKWLGLMKKISITPRSSRSVMPRRRRSAVRGASISFTPSS